MTRLVFPSQSFAANAENTSWSTICGIIMIDYLQLMSGQPQIRNPRQQEISDISRSLKELARELQVPVVALSQLSPCGGAASGSPADAF